MAWTNRRKAEQQQGHALKGCLNFHQVRVKVFPFGEGSIQDSMWGRAGERECVLCIVAVQGRDIKCPGAMNS